MSLAIGRQSAMLLPSVYRNRSMLTTNYIQLLLTTALIGAVVFAVIGVMIRSRRTLAASRISTRRTPRSLNENRGAAMLAALCFALIEESYRTVTFVSLSGSSPDRLVQIMNFSFEQEVYLIQTVQQAKM